MHTPVCLPSPGSNEVPQQKEILGSAFPQQEGVESPGQLSSVIGVMGWSRWQRAVSGTISESRWQCRGWGNSVGRLRGGDSVSFVPL